MYDNIPMKNTWTHDKLEIGNVKTKEKWKDLKCIQATEYPKFVEIKKASCLTGKL